MQQLQALWLQSSRPEARPGHIAARPAEIGNETTFNRIAAAAGLSVASMSGPGHFCCIDPLAADAACPLRSDRVGSLPA